MAPNAITTPCPMKKPIAMTTAKNPIQKSCQMTPVWTVRRMVYSIGEIERQLEKAQISPRLAPSSYAIRQGLFSDFHADDTL